MEYMYFNQKGAILTLKGGPLKLVDKFTYLESSVSSTERHKHATSKGMDSYRLAIGHMEVRPDR